MVGELRSRGKICSTKWKTANAKHTDSMDPRAWLRGRRADRGHERPRRHGNQLPNNNGWMGRSGRRATGKSQGEICGTKTAVARAAANTPTRPRSPRRFQQGNPRPVKDPSAAATAAARCPSHPLFVRQLIAVMTTWRSCPRSAVGAYRRRPCPAVGDVRVGRMPFRRTIILLLHQIATSLQFLGQARAWAYRSGGRSSWLQLLSIRLAISNFSSARKFLALQARSPIGTAISRPAFLSATVLGHRTSLVDRIASLSSERAHVLLGFLEKSMMRLS